MLLMYFRYRDWTMEKIRVSDEEIIVDSMILASRSEKENPALPSYGRNLVPYFCPNSSANPGEEDLNVATDLDAYRRAGGEIHAIPQPEASKDGAAKVSLRCGAELSELGRSFSKPLKMRKRGAAARGRTKVTAESVSSPTSPLDGAPVLTSSSSDSDTTDSEQQHRAGSVLLAQGPTWQQEELARSPVKVQKKPSKLNGKGDRSGPKPDCAGSAKPSQHVKKQPAASSRNIPSASPVLRARQGSAQRSSRVSESRSTLPERFAGAAFHNSPAPSCLPIPSFVHQKGQDSLALAQRNLFPSPPRASSPSQEGLLSPQPSTPIAGLCTPDVLRTPSPMAATALASQSGRDVQQGSAEQATRKLHELLKLGTPSPAPNPISDRAQSQVATASLRRMLQLA
ncbi:hypothetical protein KFL_000670240 [Klebsormidium nitens]|uniref:Uncharacterized protein n=1 Tax=Klebsormidium nitens TaxID=105231 RepID=A0A1Y1HWT3_KLENI|nr:hypothetical protein KFL_000670240 [Klebsormidium nitens]|eukprot:GAQ80966.1 hypothetical protein KFL_000670240 [Klebsormidium nitens]